MGQSVGLDVVAVVLKAIVWLVVGIMSVTVSTTVYFYTQNEKGKTNHVESIAKDVKNIAANYSDVNAKLAVLDSRVQNSDARTVKLEIEFRDFVIQSRAYWERNK